MSLLLPHTFADGPGNTASGVQVMDNFAALNAGIAMPTGTSLPTSGLVDGQDYYYVADATNGVVWHLKYRTAEAGANKWMFVGGSKLMASAASTAATSGAYAAFAALSITVPRSGDYIVGFGGAMSTSSTGVLCRVSVGGAGLTAADANSVATQQGAVGFDGFAREVRVSLNAAGTLQMYGQTSVGNVAVDQPWLSLVPVRCI
jgi:hypothetical protein